jgi:hypothetical protein
MSGNRFSDCCGFVLKRPSWVRAPRRPRCRVRTGNPAISHPVHLADPWSYPVPEWAMKRPRAAPTYTPNHVTTLGLPAPSRSKKIG